MSWLLPFALVSMLDLVFASRLTLPLDSNHQALVLWGGWLLVCLIFFSAVEGIFHAYYAIMLAPPLGALVGGGFARMAHWSRKQGWASVLLFAAVVLTIAFQIFSAYQYGVRSAWIFTSAAVIIVGATLFLVIRLRSAALIGILSSMLIIPLVWSILTVISETPNVTLPTAYEGTFTSSSGASQKAPPGSREADHSSLVTYLEANTADTEYLVAVPSAQVGAPLVLETGRPVLYMGGFNGSDPVIDAQGLSEMVNAGEVRYVLLGGQNRGQIEISEWVASTCTAVPQFSRAQAGSGTRQRPAADGPVPDAMQPPILYRCDPQ
jgi:4-amino-4-deoxy-L-arabinose transferase-like glycosyltransferase